jgi:porphobilinogen deaminase
VAVECATDDERTRTLLASVDHPATRAAVEVERAFLATLGSGCSLPVGAHVAGGRLYAFLADPERGRWLHADEPLPGEPAAALAAAVALAAGMRDEVARP